MRFEALEQSYLLVQRLCQPMRQLRSRDADLHRQIRRAASGIALQMAEARARNGKDRTQLFRIAAGSAREVDTALRVAEAWGDLTKIQIQPALQTLDRIRALLWGLTH